MGKSVTLAPSAKAKDGPVDDTATMRDGTRIVYSARDGGGTRRLALLHSLAMDRHFWLPLVAALPADVSVLAIDCRGHGASGKPAGPYTVELFADDLVQVMDRVGWDGAVVAGASMGGSVTLAVAAGHPGRVKGLGLIDTTAWYGADAPKAWAERGERAKEKGLADMVGFQTTRWFTDGFRESHKEAVERCVNTFLANDPAAYAEACTMLGACDMRPALPKIAVPTAIVVGREDYATPPAMSEAMHSAIPGASLTIIENGRHLTPVETPDRVAAELLKVLDAV